MWKDYLAFSKSERKAFWALSLLLLISFTLLFAVKNSKWVDDSDCIHYQNQLYAYFDSINNENKRSAEWLNTTKFNLNTCSEDDLTTTGLSNSQIKNIVAYRKKGGVFKSVADLKMIYSIDSSTFTKVSMRFEVLKPIRQMTQVATNLKYKKPDFQVEINQSDTITLSLIPGIGAVISKRIVKYRDKIGGYYNLSQLAEVYGISNELIARVSTFLTVDSTLISPKNLNQLSIFQLKCHPYLDFYKTKAIIEFRKNNGSFSTIEQVLEMKSFETCDKTMMKRYFTVK